IGRQAGSYTVTPATFAAELARARTFGFAGEAAALQAKGLIKGASAASAIVLDERGLADGGALRWPDEFVRHKAADILGDLALLGGRVRAHIVATRPSHAGNITLARALRGAAARPRWTSGASWTCSRTAIPSCSWTASSRWRGASGSSASRTSRSTSPSSRAISRAIR